MGVGARAVVGFVCEGGRLYYTFIDFSSIEHLLCAKKNELWALNLVLEITGALPHCLGRFYSKREPWLVTTCSFVKRVN